MSRAKPEPSWVSSESVWRLPDALTLQSANRPKAFTANQKLFSPVTPCIQTTYQTTPKSTVRNRPSLCYFQSGSPKAPTFTASHFYF
jgi:hypothetical protein